MKRARATRRQNSPRMLLLLGSLLTAGSAASPGQPDAAVPPAPSVSDSTIPQAHENENLVLDAPSKQETVKPGQETCVFEFIVRNTSKSPITILRVWTSCECTVATLPSKPWTLAPGAAGKLKLTLDLRGKSGTVLKNAIIETPTGYKNLVIKAVIPSG